MLSGAVVVVQGLVGIISNPVLANGVSGLATTATAFAAVERTLLYQMRNATVEPFGESVQQVFARISALRDSLDGPQVSHCTFCCFDGEASGQLVALLCCSLLHAGLQPVPVLSCLSALCCNAIEASSTLCRICQACCLS